jgi:hypothetical protein
MTTVGFERTSGQNVRIPQCLISTLHLMSRTRWSLHLESHEKLKRPTVAISPIRYSDGDWARTDTEKAHALADYLANVFTPLSANNTEDELEIMAYLDAPCQLDLPLKPFAPKEVKREIHYSSSRKAPGYDLIVGEILKHLPRKALVLLTVIFNSILRLCYYPILWKFAQIIMIPKPGKPETETQSYRSISLLNIVSKLFKRLLLNKIKALTPISTLIPNHQFGFREGHDTVQQCHRILHYIMESMEDKNDVYCSISRYTTSVRQGLAQRPPL